MRRLPIMMLAVCFGSAAAAQPAMPQAGAGGAAAMSTTGPKLNAQGKVEIGYDKRADYITIKQPTRKDIKAAAATPATANAADMAQSPNVNRQIAPPLPSAAAMPPAAMAEAPANTAKPAKPRSDSALRSDNSQAREAAKAQQGQIDTGAAAAEKASAEAMAAAVAAAAKAQSAATRPVGSLPALPAGPTR